MSSKALAFLSKKSWHTGTIRHMDKVWKAEQKAEVEQKKIVELQRELERERARKELLDAKNGGSSSSGKDSLDWMYRGVLSAATTEQELNKPYIAPDEEEDLSTPSLLQHKPVNATLDDWNKVMEDPLLQIKQREQDAIKLIAKNPLKMAEIMNALEKRKEKKKKKKSHKRKRSHKYSPERETERDRGDHKDRGETYSRQVDRSPPRKRQRRDSRSPIRYRSRSRSYSPVRRRERSRSPRPSEYRHRDDRSNRYERDSYRGSSKTSYKTQRRPRTSSISEEERERRIQEMKDSGKDNYDRKLNRYIQSKRKGEKEKEEVSERREGEENFISELKSGLYMDKDASIEDRIGRHKHYVQKDE